MDGDELAGPDDPSTRRNAVAEVLEAARARGDLGARPVDWVVEHSLEFVRALDGVTGRVADLGSGAGVPGLVVAVERPDLDIVLLDRRQHRADRLELARRRIPLDNVGVWCVDADVAARTEGPVFDAVMARSFGPPDVTLRLASRLTRPGGRVIISEPPPGVERWDEADVWSRLGLSMRSRGRVAVFEMGESET